MYCKRLVESPSKRGAQSSAWCSGREDSLRLKESHRALARVQLRPSAESLPSSDTHLPRRPPALSTTPATSSDALQRHEYHPALQAEGNRHASTRILQPEKGSMSPIHANQPDAAEEPGQRARDLTGICKDIDRLNLTGTGQDDEALQGMNVPDCKFCTALLETSAYIKGHAIA